MTGCYNYTEKEKKKEDGNFETYDTKRSNDNVSVFGRNVAKTSIDVDGGVATHRISAILRQFLFLTTAQLPIQGTCRA